MYTEGTLFFQNFKYIHLWGNVLKLTTNNGDVPKTKSSTIIKEATNLVKYLCDLDEMGELTNQSIKSYEISNRNKKNQHI